MVRLTPNQLQQTLLLLHGQVLLVPLDKREQALMPEHGELPLIHPEARKAEDDGIHDPVRQSVLLVQESECIWRES